MAATAVEAHIVDCRPFAGVPGDGAPRPWAAAKRAVLRRVGASGHHPLPARGPVLHVNPAGTVTSFPTGGSP